MNFLAKDYKTRQELENAVRNKLGLTIDKKDSTIEGTRGELAKLSLSERTMFWGIPCVILDDVPIEKPKKPDRGKKTAYGINNRDTKPK